MCRSHTSVYACFTQCRSNVCTCGVNIYIYFGFDFEKKISNLRNQMKLTVKLTSNTTIVLSFRTVSTYLSRPSFLISRYSDVDQKGYKSLPHGVGGHRHQQRLSQSRNGCHVHGGQLEGMYARAVLRMSCLPLSRVRAVCSVAVCTEQESSHCHA